jgi:hypothetical protein
MVWFSLPLSLSPSTPSYLFHTLISPLPLPADPTTCGKAVFLPRKKNYYIYFYFLGILYFSGQYSHFSLLPIIRKEEYIR